MHALRLLSAIFLLIGPVRVLAGASSPNEYVRLEVRPASTTMHPGANGILEFRFFPTDGIHVNVDPPVVFSLDSGVVAVVVKGKPVMTTDAKTGFLSTMTPVTQEIVVGTRAATGPLTVKGTVTYFFCSDSEGWCNRQKEPVEFMIMVKP